MHVHDFHATILALLGLEKLAALPAAAVTPSQQRLLEIGMALGTMLALTALGAAFLTGNNHPISRYVLAMANEPLFFSALMGTVSLAGFLIYLAASPRSQKLVWDRRSFWPFIGTGFFETFSILLIITAISMGRVVVVAPIHSSTARDIRPAPE